MINLTPYIELKQGQESIYENINPNNVVPDKMILYLRLGTAYVMSPGIYNHPFKTDTKLLGPYVYTDELFCWDRDTWKYVLKYGLVLSDRFVEYVMSEKGTEFIEKQLDSRISWEKAIEKMKRNPKGIFFLPNDAGELPIDKF